MTTARNNLLHPLQPASTGPAASGLVGLYLYASTFAGESPLGGLDASGLNHNWGAPTKGAPTVVASQWGGAFEFSKGGTVSANVMSSPLVALGMGVGTGDFTVFKQFVVPAATPQTADLHGVHRLTNGSAAEILIQVYAVPQDGKYHVHIANNTVLFNWSATPGIDPGKPVNMVLSRASGILSLTVNGVLCGTAPCAVDLAPSGNAVVGSWTDSGALVGRFEYIYDAHWTRALSPAETATMMVDPYSLFAAAAVPNQTTVVSPAVNDIVPASFTVSGTYSGSGVPSAIEWTLNGSGVWNVLDAAPRNGLFTGTISGQTAGARQYSLRWANDNSASATVSITVQTASTMSLSVVDTTRDIQPHRLFQREATGRATVRVRIAYTGSPTGFEYSVDGATWAAFFPNSIPTGGVYVGSIELNTGVHTIGLRMANLPGVNLTVPNVAVGDLWVKIGQSQMVGMSMAFVPFVAPATHPNWVNLEFDKSNHWRVNTETPEQPADDRTNSAYPFVYTNQATYGSFDGALATMVANSAGGVPIAFVPCAMGSTDAASWLPGTPQYAAAAARAAIVGPHKGLLIDLGEQDTQAGTTKASFKTMLDSIINGWFNTFGTKTVLYQINNTGISGDPVPIRAGTAEVAAANPNVLGIADMLGAYVSTHYSTLTEVNTVATRMATAMGYSVAVVNPPAAVGYPAVNDVVKGIVFGATSQFVGTRVPASDVTLPAASNVTAGVSFGMAGSTVVGTHVEAAQPGVADVRFGVTYGANASLSGTLRTPTLPAVSDVRQGTPYGVQGALVGTLSVGAAGTFPVPSNVLAGVHYGLTNEQVGTLSVSAPIDPSVEQLVDVGGGLVVNAAGKVVGFDGLQF